MLGKTTALIVAAVLLVLMNSGMPLAADPLVIKFSHEAAENSPKGEMATRLRDLVAERLEGRVRVEVYPDSQLVGADQEIEALLRGEVQLVAPALARFKRYTKQLQLYDLPFLFRDMTAVEKFEGSAKGQALLLTMESQGLMGLGYLHNGMKQLSCTSLVRVPADASGLKFGIEASDVSTAQFEAVRAVPLEKPSRELFKLLQARAIDGQEDTYTNILFLKYYEIQPYITESNHGVLQYLLVTSTDFWKSVPEDIKWEVKKALQEAIRYGNQIALDQELADRQKIIDSKRTEILTLSPAERNHWIEAMKPVWLRFEAEIGKDLIDAAYYANM